MFTGQRSCGRAKCAGHHRLDRHAGDTSQEVLSIQAIAAQLRNSKTAQPFGTSFVRGPRTVIQIDLDRAQHRQYTLRIIAVRQSQGVADGRFDAHLAGFRLADAVTQTRVEQSVNLRDRRLRDFHLSSPLCCSTEKEPTHDRKPDESDGKQRTQLDSQGFAFDGQHPYYLPPCHLAHIEPSNLAA
jgi:hypothetical protein